MHFKKHKTEENFTLPLSTNDPFTTGGQCDPAVFLPTEGDAGSGIYSHIGRNNVCTHVNVFVVRSKYNLQPQVLTYKQVEIAGNRF